MRERPPAPPAPPVPPASAGLSLSLSLASRRRFSEAFLTALHVYQTEAIGVMAAEVTKQYDKMETDLVSGTASALEVQVETASQQFALPKLPNPEKDCVIS